MSYEILYLFIDPMKLTKTYKRVITMVYYKTSQGYLIYWLLNGKPKYYLTDDKDSEFERNYKQKIYDF